MRFLSSGLPLLRTLAAGESSRPGTCIEILYRRKEVYPRLLDAPGPPGKVHSYEIRTLKRGTEELLDFPKNETVVVEGGNGVLRVHPDKPWFPVLVLLVHVELDELHLQVQLPQQHQYRPATGRPWCKIEFYSSPAHFILLLQPPCITR